jgi:diaminohydroxyphosphoribosylaminopyrimidine deaminase/5-amino-6-(5-phosphoribosylamino)uracil reductase
VLTVAGRGGHLDLRRALEALGAAGLNTLLVEGGGALAAALLREGLVDELHWFAAPTWLGAEGRPALGALGIRRLGERSVLAEPQVSRLGDDLYLRGSVKPLRQSEARSGVRRGKGGR